MSLTPFLALSDRVAPAETLLAAPGLVDVWCFFYEGTDAALLERYLDLLSPEELARHARLRFARDRTQFLCTRALARTVLSEYADVPPGAWRFEIDARGKPRVAGPAVPVPLAFNLSNTAGLVACAVSVAHARVGVDVEALDPPGGIAGLAESHFSAREVHDLRRLPETQQQPGFFAYWTLKESYLKARGLGLELPLDQFSFLLGGRDVAIAFDSRLADDPARWRFALCRASERHLLAVAADTGGAPLCARVARYVPLRSAP